VTARDDAAGVRIVPLVIMLLVGAAIGLMIGLSLRSDPPARGVEPEARRPVVPREERPAPAEVEPSPGPEPTPGDEPRPEPKAEEELDLVESLRLAIERSPTPDRLRRALRSEILTATASGDIREGPAWLLADPVVATAVLEALLAAAGAKLDEAGRASLLDLARRVAAEMSAARDLEDLLPIERRALRRAAEATLVTGLRNVLHSEQERSLREALGSAPLTEFLPGGHDGNVLSSTGTDRERMEALVIGTYRDRIGLVGDLHPHIAAAVTRYVAAADGLGRVLRGRYGRGFVEAVSSGPAAHTEAAREAREDAEYPARELAARAAYWELQAEFERALLPYLDETQKKKLREQSPAGLRFAMVGED
jgi:hypothetical protein